MRRWPHSREAASRSRQSASITTTRRGPPPKRVRDLMGDEAEELLKHRFAIINLWRPIRGPVVESPSDAPPRESLEVRTLVFYPPDAGRAVFVAQRGRAI